MLLNGKKGFKKILKKPSSLRKPRMKQKNLDLNGWLSRKLKNCVCKGFSLRKLRDSDCLDSRNKRLKD